MRDFGSVAHRAATPVCVHGIFLKSLAILNPYGKVYNMSFMKQALISATRAYKHDDVPIGAVIVHNGKIIARGENMVQKKQSGNGWTAHGVADLDTLRSDITSSSKYSQAEDTIDVSLIFPLYQPNEERNGFMFPHSDTELIPQDQISKLTDEELRYAINEIWARHGYIFENKELYNYYRQFSWYEPRISKTEWYNKGTNYFITDKIEKTNHDNLVKEREKRGGNGG